LPKPLFKWLKNLLVEKVFPKFLHSSILSKEIFTNLELKWIELMLNKLSFINTSWISLKTLLIKLKLELMLTKLNSILLTVKSPTKKTLEILLLKTEIKLNLILMKKLPVGKEFKPITKPILLNLCTNLMPLIDVLRSLPHLRCLMICSTELTGDNDNKCE